MKENQVAKILYIIGIAQIGIGFVLGLIVGATETVIYGPNGFGQVQSGFNFSIFITWTLGGFVSGMLFIGFSEVIKLLHEINWKMKVPESGKAEGLMLDTNQKQVNVTVNWELEEAELEKIKDFYQEEEIIEIIPANIEGYCVVKLQQETGRMIRIVEVSGFGVEEINEGKTKKKIIRWYNELS
ncbi:hypothetical protein SAMN05216389_101252 [Oceanobacillus limi]|uniref:Uncharacterized protein n=1 Tax=Oceanobacillus limi TaxID=930131 RepID=A0A1H9Y8B5_9BACI|nr:hypothetical protein [Oceanobacillus limi]SES65063.1 hypothetical protein SAMN05216389_101252 [Oceanobacillus limi]